MASLSSESPRAPGDELSAGEFLADGGFTCRFGSLTADEVSLARVNFQIMDVDDDGIISRADFGAAMNSPPAPTNIGYGLH